MTTTINISMPGEMYKDAKKTLKEKGYVSMSELVRDSLRKTLYEDDENENAITENGFPVWFENRVLDAEKESEENDIVIETDEDLKRYFQNIHKRVEARRNGKD